MNLHSNIFKVMDAINKVNGRLLNNDRRFFFICLPLVNKTTLLPDDVPVQ